MVPSIHFKFEEGQRLAASGSRQVTSAAPVPLWCHPETWGGYFLFGELAKLGALLGRDSGEPYWEGMEECLGGFAWRWARKVG